jgi:hypothetical protein
VTNTSASTRMAVLICVSPPLSVISAGRISSRMDYSGGVKAPFTGVALSPPDHVQRVLVARFTAYVCPWIAERTLYSCEMSQPQQSARCGIGINLKLIQKFRAFLGHNTADQACFIGITADVNHDFVRVVTQNDAVSQQYVLG